MTYEVRFLPVAARQFKKLPMDAQKRLRPLIDSLANEPRPAAAIRLQASPYMRLRSGDYRVIYDVKDEVVLVVVVAVGHRREVYRSKQ